MQIPRVIASRDTIATYSQYDSAFRTRNRDEIRCQEQVQQDTRNFILFLKNCAVGISITIIMIIIID